MAFLRLLPVPWTHLMDFLVGLSTKLKRALRRTTTVSNKGVQRFLPHLTAISAQAF
jgi:hypothetical protein